MAKEDKQVSVEVSPPAKMVRGQIWHFSRELWNDHEFWIRALAIKGGASAVVAVGVMGITHVIALPFFIAALGIALCGAFICLGIYGVLMGTTSAWDKLRDIYYKTISGHVPEHERNSKPLHHSLVEYAWVQRVARKDMVQRLMMTRAWQVTTTVTKRQQELFLTGLAGTGSVFWVVMGIVTLVTQLVVLPVVAVGSIITFGTVFAVGTVLSGIYGIYLSIDNLLRFLHIKKPREDDKTDIQP